MDTSETYIKVCDCSEIQDGWEPKVGDRFTFGGRIWFWCSHNVRGEVNKRDGHEIFLPRQGQLWRMLPIPQGQEAYGLYLFDSTKWRLYTFHGIFTGETAEQALIQGVMSELHGKIWDGKWVKK